MGSGSPDYTTTAQTEITTQHNITLNTTMYVPTATELLTTFLVENTTISENATTTTVSNSKVVAVAAGLAAGAAAAAAAAVAVGVVG